MADFRPFLVCLSRPPVHYPRGFIQTLALFRGRNFWPEDTPRYGGRNRIHIPALTDSLLVNRRFEKSYMVICFSPSGQFSPCLVHLSRRWKYGHSDPSRRNAVKALRKVETCHEIEIPRNNHFQYVFDPRGVIPYLDDQSTRHSAPTISCALYPDTCSFCLPCYQTSTPWLPARLDILPPRRRRRIILAE